MEDDYKQKKIEELRAKNEALQSHVDYRGKIIGWLIAGIIILIILLAIVGASSSSPMNAISFEQCVKGIKALR